MATRLFPYPHFSNGVMLAGSIQDWPERCKRCVTKECLSEASENIDVCPYGYNFASAGKTFVSAGVLVRDYNSVSSARASRLKREHKSRIEKRAFESALNAVKLQNARNHAAIEGEKEAVIQEYIRTEQFKADFLRRMQPDIQKGLAFVHDYKQVNAQIAQNINVIIETKYIGASFEKKLSLASQHEKAIYQASKYLEEKLASVKFLMHPEWLERSDECVSFRFHGLVYKYLQIYSPRFAKKSVTVSAAGESFHQVYANPQAVAVLPHTLIDNAAKYSPRYGNVEVTTHDNHDSITFSVASFGPRILEEEKDKIFQPFYRGINAQRIEEEGAGFGLYICQMVAKRHLGCEISVAQDQRETKNFGHWTTFSTIIPLRAAIVPWQRRL